MFSKDGTIIPFTGLRDADKSAAFESLSKALIKWINDYADPHNVIIIDATSAVLYSGEKSITTEEFIKD